MADARIIDGKATAKEVRADVKARAAVLLRQGVVPGLSVVLVGEDASSQIYVRNKDKAANEAGFRVETIRLPATTQVAELVERVRVLNADESVHGILVQLPLPDGLDAEQVLLELDPKKDVDGLHPSNVAALWRGTDGLVPCTPLGCMELLDRHDIPLQGARAGVIGRN